MRSKTNDSGLTLIELLVALTVSIIVLSIFYNVILLSFTNSSIVNKKTSAITQIKRAFLEISNDTLLTTNFLTQLPTGFSDAYGPTDLSPNGIGVWSFAGSSEDSRALILENLATTTNIGNDSRGLVSIRPSGTDCDIDTSFLPKLKYIAIYWVRDNVLYRRILTDTSETLCPGVAPYQLQSCPPDVTRDSLCQANDEVIAHDVTSFDVSYYQSDGTVTGSEIGDAYSAGDPDVLKDADMISVEISIEPSGFSQPVSLSESFTRIN